MSRMSGTIDYGATKQSLIDLTRIYKPKDVDKFVRGFVRKYNIPRGFESALKTIVFDELKKLQ